MAPSLPAPVRLLLRLMRTDVVDKVRRSHDRIRATTGDVARINLAKVNAKWLREFLDHDPRSDLAGINAPVLGLTGGKDIQVPAEDLEVIRDLVPGPVTVIDPPEVTHLLREEPGVPSLRTYRRQAHRPVSPEVLTTVGDWLARD